MPVATFSVTFFSTFHSAISCHRDVNLGQGPLPRDIVQGLLLLPLVLDLTGSYDDAVYEFPQKVVQKVVPRNLVWDILAAEDIHLANLDQQLV
jgi:hypothetical protein